LLYLTAFTQFVAWAPLPGMARSLDEQYTLMSAATLFAFGAIVWLFRKPQAQTDLSEGATAAPAGAEAGPEPATSIHAARGSSGKGRGRQPRKRRR
jgi:hypothetical protein